MSGHRVWASERFRESYISERKEIMALYVP